MSLRELKKLRTRKAISSMATQLFIERGYKEVTTAEIAEKAEVSVPTLFKYFPTKESLVFEDETEVENWLVDLVMNRKKGQGILETLLSGGIERIYAVPTDHKKNFKKFMDFIEATPELSSYSKQMWMRHEQALASVIRKEAKRKVGKLESEAIASFVLDAYHRAVGTPNPRAALKAMFKVLQNGWAE